MLYLELFQDSMTKKYSIPVLKYAKEVWAAFSFVQRQHFLSENKAKIFLVKDLKLWGKFSVLTLRLINRFPPFPLLGTRNLSYLENVYSQDKSQDQFQSDSFLCIREIQSLRRGGWGRKRNLLDQFGPFLLKTKCKCSEMY